MVRRDERGSIVAARGRAAVGSPASIAVAVVRRGARVVPPAGRRGRAQSVIGRVRRAFVAPGLVIVCGALGAGPPAAAATTTASIPVSMTIAATCNLTAADMAFGIYAGARVDQTSTVTVTCTNTTPYQVGADNGQNSVYIGVYAKYMAGPSGSRLRYHLYTDAARTIEWGTTAGSNTIAGTGNGFAQPLTFYGTIGAGSLQSVPGFYSDTVTLTVTF